MKKQPNRLMLALLILPFACQNLWANDVTTTILHTATTSDNDSNDTAQKIDTESLFYQCASVISDGARLACFDSLSQGDKPSMVDEKRPLHLSKTVVSTIKGDPKVVLADNEESTDALLNSAEIPNVEKYSPLSLAFDLDKNSGGLWRARPHNPMYILPIYINDNPNRSVGTPTQETVNYTNNDVRSTELKFQVSFKSKVAEDVFGTNADLWLGYTQQSHWQVYNEDNSRPFRAHDYQPEIFLTQPIKADLPFNGRLRMLGAGVVHHSNGEDDPLSRSWNRVYAMAGMEWGNLTVMPRLWARIAKSSDSSKPDDNPDILDYYGHGDIKLLYQMQQGNNISSTLRYNPKTKKGAVQLDYVHPIGKGVSGYIQLFQGYGQSIVDYNHKSTSIGVGVMLNDWMGL